MGFETRPDHAVVQKRLSTLTRHGERVAPEELRNLRGRLRVRDPRADGERDLGRHEIDGGQLVLENAHGLGDQPLTLGDSQVRRLLPEQLVDAPLPVGRRRRLLRVPEVKVAGAEPELRTERRDPSRSTARRRRCCRSRPSPSAGRARADRGRRRRSRAPPAGAAPEGPRRCAPGSCGRGASGSRTGPACRTRPRASRRRCDPSGRPRRGADALWRDRDRTSIAARNTTAGWPA